MERCHTRAPPPPAGPWARHIEPAGLAGRRPAWTGWDGKGFPTSFLMRRVVISVEALHLLATAPPAPFPLLALAYSRSPM
jgi:hypothetical protein